MNLFSLDVIRAKKGDCFILHYGSMDDPKIAVIDGGPADVYYPHLKPRLEEILAQRGLEDGEPLPIDLLMVSHVDDDHINGIIEMAEEVIAGPPWLSIRNFWHNSLNDVVGEEGAGDELAAEAEHSDAGDRHEAEMVLASVAQGDELRRHAVLLNLSNLQFGDEQIKAVDGEVIDMLDGLTFVVAGPMERELQALNRKYREYLEKQRDKARLAEILSAYSDTSVANLSSIVVLAEFGGKSILLTGDARGDKVLKGMKLAGLLDENGKRHVDVLKVPHHGSDRNMKTEFFEKITADHYVFSGDGEHGNPERETLRMLLDARGVEEDYSIHLTYPVDEIDVGRKKEKTDHDRPWSAEKHGLQSFFDDNPGFHAKVRIVDENNDGSPHVIDLLDKLGY